MSVQFRGNVAWEAVSLPLWSVSGWGADQCRVLWRGSRTLKRAFEDGLQKWSVLSGFAYMFLEDWGESQGTPSFPGIELRFTGFRTGSVPQPKPVDGTSLQSAQGAGIDTDTGKNISGSFTYKSSRTTWTWFETTEPPTQPRYASVRNGQNPFDNIISYSIQDDDSEKNLNSVPYSSFVAVFNSLHAGTFVSDYQREMIIPNKLWACRSEVDYKLL